MEIVNKPFLGIISATKINSKRRRAMLSHLPIRFAFFAISAILLLSGFLAIHSNQSAWAGTFPGPNGQIAFTSDRDGTREIYIMNADGSEQTRLTDNTAVELEPSWSPDGEKIAFDRQVEGSNQEIWIMNADGSEQTRLTETDTSLEEAGDFHPSWSPDGTKIAFTSNRDQNSEIYVMNADGSDQTNLSTNAAADHLPSWSPDGTKIAFTSDRDGGNSEIYIMNADGSEQTRLTETDNDIDDFLPSWSPDGEKIAFVVFSHREGEDDEEIYVMNAADGSGRTKLTDNDFATDSYPSWSPDGTKIVFDSTRDSGQFGFLPEIYVMNAADGSGQTRLTDQPDAFDEMPNWGTNTSTPGSGPTTPNQAIDKLISTIQNLDDNVPQSVKTSLAAPLKGVSHILNDDNPNNDKAACGMLDAFIKLVNVNERHEMLTADQADDLRTQAQDIRDALGC